MVREADDQTVARLVDEIAELRRALAAAQARGAMPVGVDRGAWLASILAHTPDVISILDATGAILYMNRAVPGAELEDTLGASIEPNVLPPHREAWRTALAQAVASGEPQQVVIHTIEDRWWDVRLVAIRQDARTFVLSFGKDITPQRNAERALDRKEHQLKLALEASGMGQWWWDIAADAVTWDERAKRIFDWPVARDDISYASFLERVHADDRERVAHHVEHALASGTYAPLECRVVVADGTLRWIFVTGRVLVAADGTPTDLLGGIIDITAQKERESQLRRQQKLEAIGQLAGGIAHDFNNLLVAITGNLALVKTARDTAVRDELVAEALKASGRAADLTRQLLAFSRRQQIRETLLDLGDVVDDTLQLLRRLLPATIEIEVTHGTRVPQVRGDRGQLEQVIMNLCVNARDAMVDGGRLFLRTAAASIEPRGRARHGRVEPCAHAVLAVSDTGSGIAPSALDHIFEPFFTTKEHGTGLGLATAYGIVKQHGGALEVDSEPGRGATFKVYLPAAEHVDVEAAPPAGIPVRGGHERVLFGEDEPAVRSVVTRILEEGGYLVTAAPDGARAVELFAASPDEFDVVLLDAVMPRMGGVEAAARIRALAPAVPVIVSSGYSSAFASEPMAAGDPYFLPKPYEPDTLLLAVRGALDARRG